MLKARCNRAAASRGMSIVELMVGVAVGLIVVSSAIRMFAETLSSSRHLLSETRVIQDLRAVGDLVTRDLRRAAYWDNAILGTLAVGAGSTTTANPYVAVATSGGAQITYAYTRDATEDNALGAGEQFGFRLHDEQVEMQTSQGTWQAVTNPAAVRITGFTITPQVTVLPLGHLCPKTCAAGTPNCPTVTVRRMDLLLRGQSTRDAAVVRELRSSVRMRNDQFDGVCPP